MTSRPPRIHAERLLVGNWPESMPTCLNHEELEDGSMNLAYKGPERRRRRTYVTRNTEYHFHDSLCVAVRDRRTGRWLSAHLAVNRRLSGGVRLFPNGSAIPVEGEPAVGEAMYFGDEGRELITSMLCSIERPNPETVGSYPL